MKILILAALVSNFSVFAASEQSIGTVVRVERTYTIDLERLLSNCKRTEEKVSECRVEEFEKVQSSMNPNFTNSKV